MLNEIPAEDAEHDWDLEYKRSVFAWASEKVQPEFAAHIWNAFLMTAVEEVPGAEVAKELKISIGAVYVAKSRVISRLRERIASVSGEIDLPPNPA